MTYPLVGLGLVDVDDVDEHNLEASDILRLFPIDFFSKIGYNACNMCVFENMTYPLGGPFPIDFS